MRASSIFASTFHHFCLFNIRKYNSFFNLQEYRIIDAEDQRQLIKYARDNIKLKIKNSEILQIISYARNSAIPITAPIKIINVKILRSRSPSLIKRMT